MIQMINGDAVMHLIWPVSDHADHSILNICTETYLKRNVTIIVKLQLEWQRLYDAVSINLTVIYTRNLSTDFIAMIPVRIE